MKRLIKVREGNKIEVRVNGEVVLDGRISTIDPLLFCDDHPDDKRHEVKVSVLDPKCLDYYYVEFDRRTAEQKKIDAKVERKSKSPERREKLCQLLLDLPSGKLTKVYDTESFKERRDLLQSFGFDSDALKAMEIRCQIHQLDKESKALDEERKRIQTQKQKQWTKFWRATD